MLWPFQHKQEASYWLKVFAVYALIEAVIQLLFFILLNNFGTRPISNIEVHLLMWFFQCLLIWPIWWVAWSVRKQTIFLQILVNLVFYIAYSYVWFGPVQDIIGYLHTNLQQITRAEDDRLQAILDSGNQYSYLNYQLLKHSFRLSWFYLAAYFYNYMQEERQRIALAVANRELQLKMLTWHLNPSFYFKTITHLQQMANEKPQNAAGPILQLAKIMEYVIYEAKEKLVSVRKEIDFLSAYLQLKNQQLHHHSVIHLEVRGDYEKLKIAPLLLTGIIDKVIESNNGDARTNYNIGLQFNMQQLHLSFTMTPLSDSRKILEDDSILARLNELYPGRYSVNNLPGSGSFKLVIELDDEQ